MNEDYCELEKRIGFQSNRISSVAEIMDFLDETVWIVTSPLENKGNGELTSYGNSFLSEWVIGGVYSETGHLMTRETIRYNGHELYIDNKDLKKDKDGKEFRFIISLLDYNVMGTSQTNHAIFKDRKSAVNYQMWLKIKYPSEKLLELLDKNIINGKLIDWGHFLTHGIDRDIRGYSDKF